MIILKDMAKLKKLLELLQKMIFFNHMYQIMILDHLMFLMILDIIYGFLIYDIRKTKKLLNQIK